MTRRISPLSTLLFSLVFIGAASPCSAAQPSAAALSAFHTYIDTVEARLSRQHSSPASFLAPQDAARLRRGELIITDLIPANQGNLSDALLHHWRGTAFIPGATAADFERLMKNFNAYPQRFAPQILQARILSQHDDHFQTTMRVRQQHILVVVLDTTYDVGFSHLDALHGSSTSRSTKIAEIISPGTPDERALSSDEEHGFLWRLNTYWTWEERDGGLYIQIESVSLTRNIPRGLGWIIGPFVQSVPRDSLEFTLRSASNALRSQNALQGKNERNSR